MAEPTGARQVQPVRRWRQWKWGYSRKVSPLRGKYLCTIAPGVLPRQALYSVTVSGCDNTPNDFPLNAMLTQSKSLLLLLIQNIPRRAGSCREMPFLWIRIGSECEKEIR